MSTSGQRLGERLAEAVTIRQLLERNTEETAGVLRALNGEYILPEAGGDLLRDGAGVLPTGALLELLKLPSKIEHRCFAPEDVVSLVPALLSHTGQLEFAVCWCAWLAEALSRVAGRNIHALDPYRMPSAAALQRGTAVAEAILESHRKANAGAWPETVSVRFCSTCAALSDPQAASVWTKPWC